MFIVGLTGGIGSGKSAVSNRFAQLGIDVVDADVVARVVVEPGTQALHQIEKHFGSQVITADGQLDRAALRQLVFAAPKEKQWLEQLLHPLIGAETFRQLEAASSPYVLYVTPLLVETGQKAMCDRVLVVDVPEDLQLARAMARDANSEQQIKAIMATQASRQQRLDIADDVICNDRDLAALHDAVDRLHQQYLTLAVPSA